jgi:DNA repair protein RecN (Recombination protein N)
LPQIASKGGTHFHVDKKMETDSTTTLVRCLNEQERLEEIARMLGGETLTPITMQHAKEMLDQARTG